MPDQGIETPARAQELMRRVGRRCRTASLGVRVYVAFIIFAAVYFILLMISRLLGLFPGWFTPLTLLVVPGCAAALGLVLYHKPDMAEVARVVDMKTGTDDLFLTTVMIENSAGEYKPLVLQKAEEKAGTIQPENIVTYRWAPRMKMMVLVAAILLAGVFFVPRLDPFGKEEVRQRAARQKERIKDAKKATKQRLAVLKKSKAPHSKEVKKALEELKKTINRMKPEEKKTNSDKLKLTQKELGKLWRKTSQEKLKDSLSGAQDDQNFGKGDSEKLSEWKQELREGSAASAKEELARLQRLARELENTSDPYEREKLREQIRKDLEDLARLAREVLKSKPLSSSLARAREQLDMSALKGLSKEALEAMRESMKLAQEELERLAQAARDLKSLEEALKMLQLAKKLNNLKGIDGKG